MIVTINPLVSQKERCNSKHDNRHNIENTRKMLIVCFLLSLAVAVQSQQLNPKDSLVPIMRDHFTIGMPVSWSADTSSLPGALFLFTPLENDADKFRENINVIMQDISESTTLDTYRQLTELQLKVLPNTTILESKVVETGRKPYLAMVYTMYQGGQQLKIKSFCFLKNQKAYLLTFTAALNSYEKYIYLADRTLQSFSFRD